MNPVLAMFKQGILLLHVYNYVLKLLLMPLMCKESQLHNWRHSYVCWAVL
jgi:hypothetical protein